MIFDRSIRAMALDQSPRKTGWAIGSPGEATPKYGLYEMPAWADHEGERSLAFQEWIFGMITSNGVTDVFLEAPVEHGKWMKSFKVTQSQAYQFGGALSMTYAALRKEALEIDVNEMRKRFIGTSAPPPGLKGDHGRAWLKQAAIKACAMRGWIVEDDNVAEALGHLDYGLSTLSKRHAGKSDIIFNRSAHQIDMKKFRGEW